MALVTLHKTVPLGPMLYRAVLFFFFFNFTYCVPAFLRSHTENVLPHVHSCDQILEASGFLEEGLSSLAAVATSLVKAWDTFYPGPWHLRTPTDIGAWGRCRGHLGISGFSKLVSYVC